MKIIAESYETLLADLHELASSGDFSSRCLCLRAYQSHRLRAVDIRSAFLILPLQGQKRIREGEREIQCERGNILLVPGPRRLDIENIPDPVTSEYVAISIAIHEETLEIARRLVPDRVRASRGEVVELSVDAVQEPLAVWVAALKSQSIPRACHAMVGLVLWLYERGHHALLELRPPRLADRIRSMVAESHAREWTSADVEGAMAMSGASIRRHLAVEGTSLRKIITEERLARALDLLYTTRLPVKTVAQRVGYASVPSFVKRFAERYGIEPSRISG